MTCPHVTYPSSCCVWVGEEIQTPFVLHGMRVNIGAGEMPWYDASRPFCSDRREILAELAMGTLAAVAVVVVVVVEK